jgi:hypothetical protein
MRVERHDAPETGPSVWDRETKAPVSVTVEGFVVTSPGSHEDDWREQLNEAAYNIAGYIGGTLASLGTASISGRVTVTIDGVTGVDSDDD